jgi:hypothetical protein
MRERYMNLSPAVKVSLEARVGYITLLITRIFLLLKRFGCTDVLETSCRDHPCPMIKLHVDIV